MVLRVWQMTSGPDAVSTLLAEPINEKLCTSHDVVETFVRRPMQEGRTYGMLTREYYAPLSGILHESWPEAQRRLAEWLSVVIDDLGRDVASG